MSWRALLLLAGLAAAFIVWSSNDLPAVVAAHFAAGGAPDGFMPRWAYISFMVAMTVGLPLLLLLTLGLLQYLPVSLINLPNRDYWLAAERKQATLEYLLRQSALFSALLMFLMCFVHWLVIRAHRVQPPRLPERALIVALVLFGIASLAWVVRLITHFRNGGTRSPEFKTTEPRRMT